MLIGVISDTHDRLPAIDLAIEFFSQQEVELIIHCGDWKSIETVRYFAEAAEKIGLPVRGVLGNNDAAVADFLEYAAVAPGDFTLSGGVLVIPLKNGMNLAVYHGHHKPTLRSVIQDPRNRIVALGHTHKPVQSSTPEQLIVNPGSTAFAIPRRKNFKPSVALIDTDSHAASIEYLL